MKWGLRGVAAALLLAGCGGEPAGEQAEAWAADLVGIDCCTTTRLPSPNSTRTLIFAPDAAGTVQGIVSAGWLRRQEIGATNTPAVASWAPGSQGFFVSDAGGLGRTGAFRLFRTPDNGGALELTAAPREAIAAWRAHVQCAAGASDPRTWGLGWSKDGRRVLVLVQGACGGVDRPMVVTMAAEDGRLLERYAAAEDVERFMAMVPADLRGVTTP